MSDPDRIEPLSLPGMADYHCHCDYSFDAKGTIDDYCNAAIKRNLVELCFTTHFDIEPHPDGSLKTENYMRINGEMKPTHPDLLEPYVDEVRAAHETHFAGGLQVRLGVEFGWYPGCEEMVQRIQERYGFDYMLCGLHNLDGIPFRQCFGGMSHEEISEKYFKELVAASRSGLFDTIAHLDYYKKYIEFVPGDVAADMHRQYESEVFAALTETNTALEVNTAALRLGLPGFYPSMEIVNDARAAGVSVRYLGSDAHSPMQVGYEFEAASAIIPPFIADIED